MSVSNVGGSNSLDLFQLLQQLAGNQNQNSATGASSTSDATSGVGHHHHHKGGGGQMLGQIAGAITTALQNAGSAGSTPADVNTTITNAIAGVLQGQGGNTTTQTGSTAAGTTPSSAVGQLNQVLSSAGVTPQQFWSDFEAAIQKVQAGSGNTVGSSLGALLPGSVLDTTI